MAGKSGVKIWNPWLPGSALMRASWDSMLAMQAIATTAPQVIAIRLAGLGEGPTAKNQKEVNRMVSEKIAAANESGRVLASYFTTLAQAMPMAMFDPVAAERLAKKSAIAANRSLTPYRRRVQANAKRLTKN